MHDITLVRFSGAPVERHSFKWWQQTYNYTKWLPYRV